MKREKLKKIRKEIKDKIILSEKNKTSKYYNELKEIKKKLRINKKEEKIQELKEEVRSMLENVLKIEKEAKRTREEALLIKKEAEEYAKQKYKQDQPEGGRPRGGFSLKKLLENQLQAIEPKNRKTYAELLIKKIIKEAIINGNDAQIKMIFNYIEGMPKQTIEGTMDVKTALVNFIGGTVTQAHQVEDKTEVIEIGDGTNSSN